MDVKFLAKEKDFIEAQLDGADEGLANMIVDKLLERKTVKFAAARLVHPLIATPIITVRAADAKKEFVSALEAVEDQSKALSKAADKL